MYISTPGAHTVHVYPCAVLVNPRAHCAGLQIQLPAAETSSFYFLSCLDSAFLYEFRFEADWTERAIENVTESRWRRLRWPRWDGARIKLSWRCFWKMLLEFNRLWESLDPAIQLRSLLQALQGCTVRKFDSDICSHTSGPRAALFSTYVYGTWGFGGTPLKTEAEKNRWCKRIRRDEGKGSWYLNHVGWLFCIAQVYLKPSSICSVPLCFQALWGNAHTQSPAHTVTCTVSPSAVFMIALHCHDSGFTLWWNHQMRTEQPAEELWHFTG